MYSQPSSDFQPPPSSSSQECSNLEQPLVTLATPGKGITLMSVLIPTLGFICAIALLFERGLTLRDVGILVTMYSLTVMGIGVGFHRHFSHNSFKANRVIRASLAILGSMAAQGPILFWVGIHRRHHLYAEQVDDPHSPHLQSPGLGSLVRGLWHAHIGWLFVHEITDWPTYVRDLAQDSLILRIHHLYFFWVVVGLIVPGVIGGLVTATWVGAFQGFIWGGLVRIFLVHHITSCINSICHVYGTRAFKTQDMSKNNVWLALNSFGEAWHNNHHAFPNSAIHGFTWWQIDINGWIIRGLEATGLVWDVHVPTRNGLEGKAIKPS